MESEGGERDYSLSRREYKVSILFSMMEMSMLTSNSPQILCPSSGRANMLESVRKSL